MSIASDASHRSIPIELLRIPFAKYLLKQRFKYPGRSFTRLLLLLVQYNVINTVNSFRVVVHLNLQYRHTIYLEIYIKEVPPSYLLYLPSSCLDTITHFYTKMLEGRDNRVSVHGGRRSFREHRSPLNKVIIPFRLSTLLLCIM